MSLLKRIYLEGYFDTVLKINCMKLQRFQLASLSNWRAGVCSSQINDGYGSLLQEIKKKKGIKDEVQLTSKQKELMHAQLEREAQIRKRLKEVSFRCIFCHLCSHHDSKHFDRGENGVAITYLFLLLEMRFNNTFFFPMEFFYGNLFNRFSYSLIMSWKQL